MAATGKYIHVARHAGLTIGLTSAYVAGAQRHQLNFWEAADSIKTTASPVRARISALWIKVDTIAVGATQITFRLTRDSAGNDTVIGDTTATLSTGITTATEGAITAKVDIDYKHTDSILWCHMRTNTGTCNVKQIELVWEE